MKVSTPIGSGFKTKPTIVGAKIANRCHAWGSMPARGGMNHNTTARAMHAASLIALDFVMGVFLWGFDGKHRCVYKGKQRSRFPDMNSVLARPYFGVEHCRWFHARGVWSLVFLITSVEPTVNDDQDMLVPGIGYTAQPQESMTENG